MRVRAVVALVALLAAGHAAAENAAVKACFARNAGGEQKTCMEALQRASRGELEAVYRDVVEKARARATADFNPAAAIEKSQKAFETYRNAECGEFIGGGTWGSGTAVMVMGCYAEKNYERIQELKVPFYQR